MHEYAISKCKPQISSINANPHVEINYSLQPRSDNVRLRACANFNYAWRGGVARGHGHIIYYRFLTRNINTLACESACQPRDSVAVATSDVTSNTYRCDSNCLLQHCLDKTHLRAHANFIYARRVAAGVQKWSHSLLPLSASQTQQAPHRPTRRMARNTRCAQAHPTPALEQSLHHATPPAMRSVATAIDRRSRDRTRTLMQARASFNNAWRGKGESSQHRVLISPTQSE